MSAPTRPSSGRLRAVLGGAAGNLVEWYDFYVYAAFAPYFGAAFFPDGDPLLQQLEAAVVFALGFLVRPLGSYVFGRLADRAGRKRALATSVALMGAGSLALALCPTYAAVGPLAPVLVLLARLVQGFSLGGEYGASATYLSELAPPGRRGLYASALYTTLVLGQLLATLTLLGLQSCIGAEGAAWSWAFRVPFAVGAGLALVSYGLRAMLEETAAFESARAADPDPDRGSLRALGASRRAVVQVVGLTLGGTVCFYATTLYAQRYLVQSVGLGRLDATRTMAVALAYLMVLQPIFGALSDRVGRRALLVAFGALAAVTTLPLMDAMARSTTRAGALLPLLGAFTVLALYTSVNAAVKAEAFPARVRALGVGLPYALTVSLFGGTAEAVGTVFKRAGHERGFFVYVSLCAAITGITALTLPRAPADGHAHGDAAI